MKTKRMCVLCGSKEVRQKFCADCRRINTLSRLSKKWKSDEAYRERHREAARLSFRKCHGVDKGVD